MPANNTVLSTNPPADTVFLTTATKQYTFAEMMAFSQDLITNQFGEKALNDLSIISYDSIKSDRELEDAVIFLHMYHKPFKHNLTSAELGRQLAKQKLISNEKALELLQHDFEIRTVHNPGQASRDFVGKILNISRIPISPIKSSVTLEQHFNQQLAAQYSADLVEQISRAWGQDLVTLLTNLPGASLISCDLFNLNGSSETLSRAFIYDTEEGVYCDVLVLPVIIMALPESGEMTRINLAPIKMTSRLNGSYFQLERIETNNDLLQKALLSNMVFLELPEKTHTALAEEDYQNMENTLAVLKVFTLEALSFIEYVLQSSDLDSNKIQSLCNDLCGILERQKSYGHTNPATLQPYSTQEKIAAFNEDIKQLQNLRSSNQTKENIDDYKPWVLASFEFVRKRIANFDFNLTQRLFVGLIAIGRTEVNISLHDLGNFILVLTSFFSSEDLDIDRSKSFHALLNSIADYLQNGTAENLTLADITAFLEVFKLSLDQMPQSIDKLCNVAVIKLREVFNAADIDASREIIAKYHASFAEVIAQENDSGFGSSLSQSPLGSNPNLSVQETIVTVNKGKAPLHNQSSQEALIPNIEHTTPSVEANAFSAVEKNVIKITFDNQAALRKVVDQTDASPEAMFALGMQKIIQMISQFRTPIGNSSFENTSLESEQSSSSQIDDVADDFMVLRGIVLEDDFSPETRMIINANLHRVRKLILKIAYDIADMTDPSVARAAISDQLDHFRAALTGNGVVSRTVQDFLISICIQSLVAKQFQLGSMINAVLMALGFSSPGTSPIKYTLTDGELITKLVSDKCIELTSRMPLLRTVFDNNTNKASIEAIEGHYELKMVVNFSDPQQVKFKFVDNEPGCLYLYPDAVAGQTNSCYQQAQQKLQQEKQLQEEEHKTIHMTGNLNPVNNRVTSELIQISKTTIDLFKSLRDDLSTLLSNCNFLPATIYTAIHQLAQHEQKLTAIQYLLANIEFINDDTTQKIQLNIHAADPEVQSIISDFLKHFEFNSAPENPYLYQRYVQHGADVAELATEPNVNNVVRNIHANIKARVQTDASSQQAASDIIRYLREPTRKRDEISALSLTQNVQTGQNFVGVGSLVYEVPYETWLVAAQLRADLLQLSWWQRLLSYLGHARYQKQAKEYQFAQTNSHKRYGEFILRLADSQTAITEKLPSLIAIGYAYFVAGYLNEAMRCFKEISRINAENPSLDLYQYATSSRQARVFFACAKYQLAKKFFVSKQDKNAVRHTTEIGAKPNVEIRQSEVVSAIVSSQGPLAETEPQIKEVSLIDSEIAIATPNELQHGIFPILPEILEKQAPLVNSIMAKETPNELQHAAFPKLLDIVEKAEAALLQPDMESALSQRESLVNHNKTRDSIPQHGTPHSHKVSVTQTKLTHSKSAHAIQSSGLWRYPEKIEDATSPGEPLVRSASAQPSPERSLVPKRSAGSVSEPGSPAGKGMGRRAISSTELAHNINRLLSKPASPCARAASDHHSLETVLGRSSSRPEITSP